MNESKKGPRSHISVGNALDKLHSSIDWQKLAPMEESVDLLKAHGRVLAADVKAPLDIPPFSKAAMDGYAVRSQDTTSATKTRAGILRVVGNLAAGQSSTYHIGPGEAISIATGARLPDGADAVVMVERTHRQKDSVKILERVKPFENVSVVGEDLMKGNVVMKKGRWLSSQDIGALAAMGLDRVAVLQRPRVAIIATGDELVEPGGNLGEATIFESNRYMISCMIAEYGGIPVDLGLCKDNKQAISSKLKEAAGYDMLVVCGGTSVGPTDYVPELVNSMGKPGLIVHGVAMKPGSPTGLAAVNGIPIILVPGFPVSAYVAFYTFGRPTIFRMLGTSGPANAYRIVAKLVQSVKVHPNMRTFVRVKLIGSNSEDSDSILAEPVSATGARLLSTLVNSHGMVIVDDKLSLRKGEKVEVIPFGSVGL